VPEISAVLSQAFECQAKTLPALRQRTFSPLLILIKYGFPCVFYFNFLFSVFCFNLLFSVYCLNFLSVSSNSISQWRSGQWSQMIEDDESNISD
jgi:hypothetical protein